MASAKSLVKSLPHLGSSYGEVLLSANSFRRYFTVERASASFAQADLSRAAIAEARRLLTVRKRLTARRSINILHVQTRIDVLKTSARADLIGAAKIFGREIGEERSSDDRRY
jgi:hypothetical protein